MSASPLHVLHFADAHIDMINHGRHDPQTGLPMRVVDFLTALDHIIDRALAGPTDLVIFAGDAYKDRNPQPTFQREWGRRMMRLSAAGIPTILLIGNHDKSPAQGRAHALHEYDTLGVPHIHIGDRLRRFGPEELGRPVQVITLPWLSPSVMLTKEEMGGRDLQAVWDALEERLTVAVEKLIAEADPNLPLILTAHASVHGARYGSERQVMLGRELVLPTSLVRDRRLDYVALGHIHRHQELNQGAQPPIVYPGSIERIDFGEAREPKGYVVAEVQRGRTQWRFVRLPTRPFIDVQVEARPDNSSAASLMPDILAHIPPRERLADAICRLQLSYPRDWESALDEAQLGHIFSQAFSFQLVRNRYAENRSRLGNSLSLETLTPEALLTLQWEREGLPPAEIAAMLTLSREVLGDNW